jgi:hypothetical protein
MKKKINNNKYNSIEFLKKENSSLTKLYKDSLIKMKKIQRDYESMYSKFVNENQLRENFMKNNYIKYQELLQQHFQKEENNYIEEIKNLKLQIQEKDKVINALQNNNALLNDKLSKNELIYNLKEKEYQNQLLNKDRLLMKSSDIVNKNSYEVMEDIKKLKEEIKYFQNKANNNNINNNDNYVYDNNQNNLNYFNNEYKRQQQIKKSLSSNNFNDIRNYSDLNSKNNFNNNLTYYNTNNPQIRNFNSNQNSPYAIKTKTLNNNANEIHKLKTRIINLMNIIKQKDKEINFWKNLRQNLYKANTTQNIDNNIYNKTYINSMNNYRNINSEQKIMKRCNSQTANQIRQNKRKKFNLYLIDSNINKPIKRNIITYKNKMNT